MDYSIKELTNLLLSNNNAFACYKLPDEKDTHYNIFKDNQLKEVNQETPGVLNNKFLFHPFDDMGNTESIILNPEIEFSNKNIPSDIKKLSEKFKINSKSIVYQWNNYININKSDYLKLVTKAVDRIKFEEIDKVVLSRQIYKKELILEKAADYFVELIKNYNSAFVYFIHIPGKLAWMGATPELFLSGINNNFNTVSLAGTINNRNNQQNIIWKNKEILEQEIVSKYIEDELNKLDISIISREEPSTISTGNLFHIQTKFNFDSKTNDIYKIIKALHPTPAVCGFPKKRSLGLINSLEPNDRQYYAGLVGTINSKSKTNLFVNLRCMQLISE